MKTFIVDSFTNEIFRGNPAGVCITESELSDELMLNIARELNLSETAFIQRADGNSSFTIRFFSPKMEIPLCGHATLASARVAAKQFGFSEVQFVTGQGVKLEATSTADSISMKFPVYETFPAIVTRDMLSALGIDAIVDCGYNEELKILLIEIESKQALRNLTPDFEALCKTHDSINGVLITARSTDDGYDFHSRYFWPWSGTNEDPVTGGTHTFLTKYWAKKLGRSHLRSFQSSKRTGFMELELHEEYLVIRSQAVVVLEGQLSLDGR